MSRILKECNEGSPMHCPALYCIVCHPNQYHSIIKLFFLQPDNNRVRLSNVSGTLPIVKHTFQQLHFELMVHISTLSLPCKTHQPHHYHQLRSARVIGQIALVELPGARALGLPRLFTLITADHKTQRITSKRKSPVTN